MYFTPPTEINIVRGGGVGVRFGEGHGVLERRDVAWGIVS